MEIAFISKYPSLNIKNWSGTEYFTAQALAKQCDLYAIAGLKEELTLSVRLKNKLFGRNNKKYWIKRSPEIGKSYARQVLKQIKPTTDIVFSTNTESIAYLDIDKPKVFYADATFASMIGYYDWFDNLSNQTYKEGMMMEQKAIDSCQLAVFSSDWAAQSAINDYRADPKKVKVVPFGANITSKFGITEIHSIINNRDRNVCKILFIGVEWYRKGGDIVIDTVRYMNDVMNIPTELHLVGIDDLPIKGSLPPYIINHKRIDKSVQSGIDKIEKLIEESHVLLVPSRADCTPIVFSEAMTFGVPCISTQTGGIPSIVKDGINGFTLPLESSPKEYAEKISELFNNKNLYEEMALLAFRDSQTRLNWDVVGETITTYLKELI